MQKTILIAALLFPAMATAADLARCGTDAFGNVVCLDKDGVLTTLPKRAADDRKAGSASGVPATESQAGQQDAQDWLRCGTDPFGNKVCRQ